MSKISLSPDVAGTGIFTIASPNSDTNRTLTLPDDTGTIVTNSGNQAGSFTTLNTSGQVVFNDAGADVDFRVEGDTDANLLFVDASADAVGMGAAVEANSKLTVKGAGIAISRDSSSVFTSSAYDIKIRSASPKVGIHATSSSQNMTLEFSGGGSANAIIDVTSNDGLVFRTNNIDRMSIASGGAVNVVGALSKGSGSFKIDHPLKPETHHLIHSFIEGPQADLIYRGKVELVAGHAEVNIDTVAGMTEGTFVALNREVQCFTSNESDWDAVRGSVTENILTIECQNAESTATISWMVIGERQDQHMYDTDWTDENGKVIVEPLKPVKEAVETVDGEQ